MLCGRAIQTKKDLSDGLRYGDRIYFLCEYVLYEPGKTVIPILPVLTPQKIYFDAVFLYAFDIAGEKLTRLAALKPTSSHTGRGDVRNTRWAAAGPLLYLRYNTGWDKVARESVHDVFRFDPDNKTVEELTGDEKKILTSRHFAKRTGQAPGGRTLSFTDVWYHVGGIPADEWGLPSPLEYGKLSNSQCLSLIIEQRGDRYLRDAAFRRMRPSLSIEMLTDIADAMDRWRGKLPKYKQMMYAPHREEWFARLALEARYGSAAKNDSLEAALFRKDRRGTKGFLIKNHDVNRKDEDGRTPLMIAAYADNTEGIADLLKRGAAVNARDAQGRTPLMYAVFGNAPHALELLLRRSADTKLQTRSGQTVWMFVASTELRQHYLKNTGK